MLLSEMNPFDAIVWRGRARLPDIFLIPNRQMNAVDQVEIMREDVAQCRRELREAQIAFSNNRFDDFYRHALRRAVRKLQNACDAAKSVS
jgi:hypothetical protein